MTRYDVGGVMLDRPFKVRRLGHFGLFQQDLESARRFYAEDLGLSVTDELAMRSDTVNGLFLSNNTDHHAVVCIDASLAHIMGDVYARGITLNQLSFQVSTLEEVVRGHEYLKLSNTPIWRMGRDFPGSNWACYGSDPDGYLVEIFYGMEQVGWDRRSKPRSMHRPLTQAPPLPQPSEADELLEQLASDGEIAGRDRLPRASGGAFTIGGVTAPVPFCISRIGPVHLFVNDIDVSIDFYTRLIGLELTEIVEQDGLRAAFLRAGTDHHVVGLFERGLREALGYSDKTLLAHACLEISSYSQLRAACAHMTARGWRPCAEIPHSLLPGIGRARAFADPSGHAVLLYFGMEQIGWDGRPRPAAERPDLAGPWPEVIAGGAGAYVEPPRQGPVA